MVKRWDHTGHLNAAAVLQGPKATEVQVLAADHCIHPLEEKSHLQARGPAGAGGLCLPFLRAKRFESPTLSETSKTGDFASSPHNFALPYFGNIK